MQKRSVPFWFVLAFVPMVASQIVRLYQTSALGWIICDYSGRLAALAILAAIPTARAVAFQRQKLRTSWWETLLWCLALFLFHPLIGNPLWRHINHLIPHTWLDTYPNPHGWLLVLDASAGLLLVAYEEEIYFRRCAQAVFGSCWGNGIVTISMTSLFFAAYHWTTGLGNITANLFFGLIAILCLRRIGALWPIVVAHYLADLNMFYVLPYFQ
jgi:hypothetical protein